MKSGKTRGKEKKSKKGTSPNQNSCANASAKSKNEKRTTSTFTEHENHVVPEENSDMPNILKSQLRNWVTSYHISTRAVDGLLSVLKYNGIDEIPKTHRTLLQTPLNVEIDENAGGMLWYYGLEKCLKNIFSGLNRAISIGLKFNLDGLPLYRSSKTCLWPILGSIYGTYRLRL